MRNRRSNNNLYATKVHFWVARAFTFRAPFNCGNCVTWFYTHTYTRQCTVETSIFSDETTSEVKMSRSSPGLGGCERMNPWAIFGVGRFAGDVNHPFFMFSESISTVYDVLFYGKENETGWRLAAEIVFFFLHERATYRFLAQGVD